MSTTRTKRMQGTNFRDSKGIYTWKEERFPSVTTILKNLDKPALPRWAAKSVAEFVTDQATRRNSGQITGQQLMTVLLDTDKLKGVPWEYAQKKMDLGSTLHNLAEQITLGTPVNPEVFAEDLRAYVVSFLNWYEKSGAVFEASEFAVFNREFKYAGTSDGIVKYKGRTLVIDFKSSPESYEEHALQLSAYRHGEFIGMQDGTEEPMPATDGGAILIVQPGGCKLVEWPTGEDAFAAFTSLRSVYAWRDARYKYKEI